MYDQRKVDAGDSMIFLVGFNKIKRAKCKDTTHFDSFLFFNHTLLVIHFFDSTPPPKSKFLASSPHVLFHHGVGNFLC